MDYDKLTNLQIEIHQNPDMGTQAYYDLLIKNALLIVTSTAFKSQAELAVILNMAQPRVSITINLLKAYLRRLDDEN